MEELWGWGKKGLVNFGGFQSMNFRGSLVVSFLIPNLVLVVDTTGQVGGTNYKWK